MTVALFTQTGQDLFCHGLPNIVPFLSLCFSVVSRENQQYSGKRMQFQHWDNLFISM